MPNPAEQADFRINGLQANHRSWPRLDDCALGRPVRTAQFIGAEYRFQRLGLAAGLYYFRVEAEDGRSAGGKLMLK